MADTIWVPDPTATPPDDDFRLLVCVQTDRRLYVLLDGPAPDQPPPPAGQHHRLRVRTDIGEELEFISGGSSIDRQCTVVTGWFRSPADRPAELQVQLDIGDDNTIRSRAIRITPT